MPEKETLQAARRDKRQGKAASTQAGEFIREEMHHIRAGKHGARSTKQAIAIGLSKARRAGVDLPPPRRSSPVSDASRSSAARAFAAGQGRRKVTRRPRIARAVKRVLRKQPHVAASHAALARQARSAAAHRSAAQRIAAARQAARTRARHA